MNLPMSKGNVPVANFTCPDDDTTIGTYVNLFQSFDATVLMQLCEVEVFGTWNDGIVAKKIQ